MSRIWFFLLFCFLFVIGCSSEKGEDIRISTNSWIGYAPLFYAKETGELDKIGIKLMNNVSLAEASKVFEIGKADLVTTTQHEYYSLKDSVKEIIPIILIDRSNGGDMVMSNRTIEELKNEKQIYTYLESDSINNELLTEFLQNNAFSHKNLIFNNKDQIQISNLNNTNKAMLLVTYAPYNIKLQEQGFQELASTKNLDSLIVIDALCASTAIYTKEKKRLQQLKQIIDNAIEVIEEDPKKVYTHVAKYLDNISYEEYLDSLKMIKWINKDSSTELMQKIEKLGYKRADLIQ